MVYFKEILIACVICALAGGLVGYAIGRGGQDEPIPVPPALPPKVVTVQVVKEIPGPVRYKTVERVKFQTKSVEVPVERLKEVVTFVDPIGRVRLDANKFEGLSNGTIKYGWKGNAVCEFAPKTNPNQWVKLVESPFDLTESRAETTTAPAAIPKRLRLDLGLGVSSRGPLVQAGFARRIVHKGFLGRTFVPDWAGASVGYSGGSAQVLVSLGKEF